MSKNFMTKCVLLGQPGVGKTSILRLVQGQNIPKKYMTTAGLEVVSKAIRPTDSDSSLELFIFDFSGRSLYDNLTRKVWSTDVSVIIGVFDVTREDTFYWLQKKMTELLKQADHPEEMIGIILGNKCDLTDRRVVTSSDAHQLAKRYKMRYFDVSAKEMKSAVDEAFFHVTHLWIEKKRKM